MKTCPHPIDLHIAKRLKIQRQLLKMSQKELGEKIGISFQQMQKYENGSNRISASRLFDLAQILEVPISFFFEDSPLSHFPPRPSSNPLFSEDSLNLISSYKNLPLFKQRALYTFLKTFTSTSS